MEGEKQSMFQQLTDTSFLLEKGQVTSVFPDHMTAILTFCTHLTFAVFTFFCADPVVGQGGSLQQGDQGHATLSDPVEPGGRAT